MDAKEMLEKVQDLKEEAIFYAGGTRTSAIEDFFNENWMQILDILDDALYAYLGGGTDGRNKSGRR